MIVHHSQKIYPTVTSPEGEGSFPCCDGLCHEIEWGSPRSHFPCLTFVGNSWVTIADSLMVCNGWGEIDKNNFLLCSKIVPESRIYTRAPT